MGKHLSKYSEYKVITDAQYITELLCENRAKDKGLELQYNFWTLNEWKGYYYSLLKKINNLLKYYSAGSIIRAIEEFGYSTCSEKLIARSKKNEEELENTIRDYIEMKKEQKNG